jgi:uncharacterized protein (TIGR03086 family)
MSFAGPLRQTGMDHFDLGPATTTLADVVRAVRDDQLGGPTPCEGTPVAALLDHIAGLALAFTVAATREFERLGGRDRPQASADALADDWREAIPRQLDELAAAWREPAAWEGMTKAGGVDLPGEIGALVALDEVVIHGWDLAVATGQRFTVDPALLEAVHGFVSTFEAGPDVQLFGPEVPVPTDAPLLDRTLGKTGRDPAWRPHPHAT